MSAATVEVITGPMFGGKTWELIHRILENRYGRKRELIVKPPKDTRTVDAVVARGINNQGEEFVVYSLPAVTVANPLSIIGLLEDHKPALLAIDEAHLFPSSLVHVINTLRNKADSPPLRIVIAGLDMDYRREPFPSVAHFLAIADAGIWKATGVCMACGARGATYTQALRALTSNTHAGSGETYEVRCRACHTIP